MSKIIKIALMLIILICSVGCSSKLNKINSLEDLKNKKVGIYTGSEYDKILKMNVPDSKPVYYNSYNDEISSLKSNKISAFLTDEPLSKEILRHNKSLAVLDKKLTNDSYAFAISRSKKELKKQIDNVIISMKNDGTLQSFQDKWFSYNKNTKLEKYNYTGNKKIRFATVSGSAPFAFMKDNSIVGYDIEVINYIGYKLGYDVEIIEMSFEGIIPALISSKVDIAGCSIIVTEDRKKSVLFSEPNYTGGIVVIVNK